MAVKGELHLMYSEFRRIDKRSLQMFEKTAALPGAAELLTNDLTAKPLRIKRYRNVFGLFIYRNRLEVQDKK